MSRVKIKFPPHNPLYTAHIPVRITDLNYGGHVGNDKVLSIIHEARVMFLTHFGYSELDMGGVAIIMADSAIAYKAEGFYGDVLDVDIYVDEINKYGFELLYKVTKEGSEGGKIDVAHASTGIVCFNYDERKITELPELVKTQFSIVKN